MYSFYKNFKIIAITKAKIPRASANAIANIIVDLISPAEAGFLPIALRAAKPIRPIAIAGQNAPRPKDSAIAISFIIY